MTRLDEPLVATYMDRSGWPSGPWDGEPDRVEWRHRRVPCLAHRAPRGSWCGYVGVLPEHPWYGLDMFDLPCEAHDPAHGGITYSRAAWSDPPRGVCHTPRDGEPPPDALWWVGFDCLHLWDLPPEPGWPPDPMAVYRDLDYVARCVERLADAAIGAVR